MINLKNSSLWVFSLFLLSLIVVASTGIRHRHFHESMTDDNNLKNTLLLPVLRQKDEDSRPSGFLEDRHSNTFGIQQGEAVEMDLDSIPAGFLDPESETCRWKEIKYNVTTEGCRPQLVHNKLCYGRCASLYLPGNGENFEICSQCKPSKVKLVQIPLQCDDNSKQNSFTLTYVKECECRSCGGESGK